jgi:ABC-2 type transport system permease protein
VTYARSELLRAFRNRRFFILSIVFPLVLFWMIAGPQRDEASLSGTGIPAPVYYMVTMAAYGGMLAVMGAGARIAAEREAGWTRQLRLSPLPVRTYFRTKLAVAYLTALASILLLYASGLIEGVHLDAGRWLEMTGFILVGLVPFAALGIVLGHLLTADSIGPALGGGVALLALIGGFWFPITGGFLHAVGPLLPSWWLVQASHVSIGGSAWSAEGWAVVAAWSALLAWAAARAYRRDAARA